MLQVNYSKTPTESLSGMEAVETGSKVEEVYVGRSRWLYSTTNINYRT